MEYDSSKLKQIATLLESTMTNAGIMDDYDEIIGNFIEEDPENAAKYHEEVMTGLTFINEQLNSNYDVSRDGSGVEGEYSVHMTYLEILREQGIG